MPDIHKLSDQVIELAERAADVDDAAKGKGRRASRARSRWFVLPAAGAAFYAFARSDFFSRQAKEVVDEAKNRAADLPSDLLKTVRQTAQKSGGRNGARSTQASQSSSSRRTSQRRRRSTSARRSTSSR